MDQIREHVTRVLDKQGVLSRLKAELRANVFLAINDQDIAQGGVGLGGKSDATHRMVLAADPSGVLLLELVRELMQWSNLQFTQQIFEQEMQLGPAAAMEVLQAQLGAFAETHTDQPLLLQLLKHHLEQQGRGSWRPAAQPTDAHKASPAVQSGQHGSAVGTPTSSKHDLSLPLHQLQAPAAAAAAADITQQATAAEAEVQSVPVVAQAAAGEVVSAPGGVKLPSKSMSLLGVTSVPEESGLIGTALDEEDDEYATVLLPKHGTTSSDAHMDAAEDSDADDGASSTSSTYPVDTPRLMPRPARAATGAAAAARGQQGTLPALAPTGRPLLPPVALSAAGSASQGPVGGDGGWSSLDAAGMAAACELSESFGHDRSFGDSSLELQGQDSLQDRAGPQHMRAAVMGPEASYSSSGGSSSRTEGSSRALSPSDIAQVQVPAEQAPAAAAVAAVLDSHTSGPESLPAVRAQGKLAPLPPVNSMNSAAAAGSSSSSSGGGVLKRTSEGVRDELLRSGLLTAHAPPAGAPRALEDQPQARPIEPSSDSCSASNSQALQAAEHAGPPIRAEPVSATHGGSAGVAIEDFGSWRSKAASAAAAVLGSEPMHSSGSTGSVDALPAGGVEPGVNPERSASRSDGDSRNASGDEDSDDFEALGQQQLLQAARRRLSDRSGTSEAEEPRQQGWQQQDAQHGQQVVQQQEVQQRGRLHLEVSGASLTLTCSDLDDDDSIPEDLSLPIEDLLEGSEYSALFDSSQQTEPAGTAAHQPQAWSAISRPAAVAAMAAGPGSRGSMGFSQGAQQALELTDGSEDDDDPLAAAGGFVIDDDF